MCLDRGQHFLAITPFRPEGEKFDLLFAGKDLQGWILLEKAMKRFHEIRAGRALEINEGQIVVGHADFFEALAHRGTALGGEREHVPVHLEPLRAGAAQGFPPRGDREGWLRGQPNDSFLIRDLLDVWLQKARAPKIIEHLGGGRFAPTLARAREK